MALSPTNINIPRSGDPLCRMHLTRPKSAKGRTRTNPVDASHSVEAYSNHVPSPSPRVPASRPASRISPEDVPELLHQIPCRPPSSSLNRYKVLPSIRMSGAADQRADDEELAQHTSTLRLGGDSQGRQMKALYRDQTQTVQHNREASQEQKPQGIFNHSAHGNLPEPSDQQPPLLLAIRSHTGQRFERYFRPTDTLLTVLAAAEEQTGVSCKDCSVESMEVPRRSFPILSWTLQQCGIPNKSVLCIHQLELD
ncbi:UBX domain-containing protein 10 [Xenopus tropicalis]|uniref:UBX domain protein 10 n=1 Tax=Xenopus tropicalis TaxID=8364 RepID=A0A1B8XWW1_XENTR|nr:UBX domain-containing protein 10 [Xenopus tropicalis]|eukprot:XP_012823060.1 PREDICTED: UBX domain-containing protein 10 [Xenopus tropicalis]